jgi:hypothetical protein
MNLAARRDELMRYFRIDPVTLKVVRDPATGKKVTTGPGTMDNVLADVIRRAEKQYVLLDRTRDQMRSLREELADTIRDLNGRKVDLRIANSTIRDRDGTVAMLRGTIDERDRSLAAHREEIETLSRNVSDVEGELVRSRDEVAQLEDDVEKLQHELNVALGDGGPKPGRRWAALTRGQKGEVVAVDTEWDFVVLHFTEEFMAQYNRLAEFGAEPPDPKLSIMREGREKSEFVTMVQLCYVNPEERLGVANILSAWVQQPVTTGDSVVF